MSEQRPFGAWRSGNRIACAEGVGEVRWPNHCPLCDAPGFHWETVQLGQSSTAAAVQGVLNPAAALLRAAAELGERPVGVSLTISLCERHAKLPSAVPARLKLGAGVALFVLAAMVPLPAGRLVALGAGMALLVWGVNGEEQPPLAVQEGLGNLYWICGACPAFLARFPTAPGPEVQLASRPSLD